MRVRDIVEHVEAKRERVVRIDEAVQAYSDERSGFDRLAAFGQKPHDRIVNFAGAIEPQSDDRAGVEVQLARAAVGNRVEVEVGAVGEEGEAAELAADRGRGDGSVIVGPDIIRGFAYADGDGHHVFARDVGRARHRLGASLLGGGCGGEEARTKSEAIKSAHGRSPVCPAFQRERPQGCFVAGSRTLMGSALPKCLSRQRRDRA